MSGVRSKKWAAGLVLVSVVTAGSVAALALAGDSPTPQAAPDPVSFMPGADEIFEGSPTKVADARGNRFMVGLKRGAPSQSCVAIQPSGTPAPGGGCGPTEGLKDGFMMVGFTDGGSYAVISGLAPAGVTEIRAGRVAEPVVEGFYSFKVSSDVTAVTLVGPSGPIRTLSVGQQPSPETVVP